MQRERIGLLIVIAWLAIGTALAMYPPAAPHLIEAPGLVPVYGIDCIG